MTKPCTVSRPASCLQWIAFLFMLFAGCKSHELTPDIAFKVLKKEFQFPVKINGQLNRRSNDMVLKIESTPLENEGYVKIIETYLPIDSPRIYFTKKADTFLLPTSIYEQRYCLQNYQLAEEDIFRIDTIMPIPDGTQAAVSYTTRYSTVTPFALLQDIHYGWYNTRSASLYYEKGQWHADMNGQPGSFPY